MASLVYKHTRRQNINNSILFSNLVPLAQGLMKRKYSPRMEVPNNTSADNTSAIEQTVPPRGAMQGPACGELSY